MNPNRNPRTIFIIVILLAAVAFGVWYFTMRPAAAANGVLSASGTVETNEISIAPELSGKIVEINVQEGDTVKTGDVLFRLDDTLLKAQRNVAAAGLETAKTAAATADAAVAAAQIQYDIAFNAAMTQNRPTRTVDWYKGQPGEFTLPLWYYDQTEQINAAQTEVDAAKSALSETQDKLTSIQSRAAGADFIQAETDLAAAQAQYQVAKDLHDRVTSGKNIEDLTRRQLFLLGRDVYLQSKGLDPRWVTLTNSVNKELRDAAQKLFDDAKSKLEDAQDAYNDAVTTDGAKDIMKARAQVSIAEERYYTAMDYVRILQTGADSPTVTAAQKVLDQTRSAATQTQSAIAQAQANLDLIDAQIAKTIITSPVDGVVLNRIAEPGSVVNPGSTLLTLGRLDELTITVYVPEDRLGEVAMGQVANVTVDSFPGETFTAAVTYISSQAEFTPRNVQTVEGRKNTVFAVKLKLGDTSGKLKPGMPADVTFSQK
jgi:multidrug resistance efflux pump